MIQLALLQFGTSRWFCYTGVCRGDAAAEKACADKLEAELAVAERQLSQLAASSSELDSLEERYWHDFNDFHLQLRAHVDERDVLLNKVCAMLMVKPLLLPEITIYSLCTVQAAYVASRAKCIWTARSNQRSTVKREKKPDSANLTQKA